MNQVLRTLLLFGSSSFSAFTVRFDEWDQFPMSLFNKFVEFALAKRFQRLEFDMNPIGLCTMCNDLYTFPIELYDWIKQPCGLYRISALTSLTLRHINVTGEFIEYILSNCPLLERLCVEDSDQLLNLKVSGAAALRLKYLEINCYYIESLEVSAPNLLSLNYIGSDINLQVENVPKLVEASIGRDVITYMSGSLSSYLSQLQTLLLEFEAEVARQFTQVVVLNKLKHLVLRVVTYREESLLGWISLIDAWPFLQKFTLEAMTSTPNYRKKIREVRKVTPKHPHQCLKVVELAGFTGVATEVELAMYFFENATMLEQVIIDRRGQCTRGTPFEFKGQDIHSEVKKKRALQLKKYLPPGVELVLI